MGLIRKFGIGLAILAGLIIFQFGRTQYRLVKSTFTINNLPPNDPVFSSVVYSKFFGHRTWAKIESFGCGVAIPLNSVREDLLQDDGVFAAESMRVLWNARMRTQSNATPWPTRPEVGSTSASDAIRAEVVETGPVHMAMTITTLSTGFTGGLEVIQVMLDANNDLALVAIKYLWHNDVVLPRTWYQYLAIWMQLTSRRVWLMDVLGAVVKQQGHADAAGASEGRGRDASSARAEL